MVLFGLENILTASSRVDYLVNLRDETVVASIPKAKTVDLVKTPEDINSETLSSTNKTTSTEKNTAMSSTISQDVQVDFTEQSVTALVASTQAETVPPEDRVPPDLNALLKEAQSVEKEKKPTSITSKVIDKETDNKVTSSVSKSGTEAFSTINNLPSVEETTSTIDLFA